MLSPNTPVATATRASVSAADEIHHRSVSVLGQQLAGRCTALTLLAYHGDRRSAVGNVRQTRFEIL
jgi:hypothetical protein